jgi:GNAT superfamily N-acetyltransferase
MAPLISLRTDLRLKDLQAIIDLHGTIYSQECGWNASFKAYVAGPLIDWFKNASPSKRLWIAERDGMLVGCVAIVTMDADIAQLRWFLVAPAVRGQGLGKRLLTEAIAFAKGQEYAKIILWTEQSLKAAAHLYAAAGFVKTEEKPGWKWGAHVVEEKYELANC